ncbi:transcription factor subunit Med10 of mediator complex-domain-containing protein [Geopyxis carbonaria]|nr:transcription factor subunit Med10 of mediator complex-domain-containing protein [Geopyxis carbonaria]
MNRHPKRPHSPSRRTASHKHHRRTSSTTTSAPSRPLPGANNSTAMAPSSSEALKGVENQLHTIIQHLYTLLVSTHGFAGPDSTDTIATTISELVHQFQSITAAASAPSLAGVAFPQEVIQYVEDGRNPDIYTREFVEMAQKSNQYANGKVGAFRGFRDVLAEQIVAGFPELGGEVEKVLGGTGGRREEGAGAGAGGKEAKGRINGHA